MSFKKVDSKMNLPEMEEGILKFWEENKIFNKSIDKDAPKGEYVFYDGPPFITGLPHYATLLPSIAKDLIPRYWTMKGYRVKRVWGWDCHGLPAENKVEKDLGLKNKKDIETLGVDKFIEACHSYVSTASDQWKWYINRIGRWVDMEHAYQTMSLDFMESVMWSFKRLYEKGLIYEGYRSSLHCPRCATPLSKFEITMDAGSYKNVSDESVTVEFKIKNLENTFALAWTTTPWTLPGNLALAAGNDIQYVKIEKKDNGGGDLVRFILAKDQLKKFFGEDDYKIVEELKGSDLAGLEYEPVFDLENEKIKKDKKVFKIYTADFVTTEDGTGIVHIAPNFGDDDFTLGQKEKLPILELMDENGIYTEEVGKDWQGLYFKKANKKALEELEKNGKLFSKFSYVHSYPFCYRCATPLIYKSQRAWYLDIQKIRQKLIDSNEEINWIPEYFKDGRFRYNLENAPDWCLSRSRYWGSPIPVWKCHECGEIKVIGSTEELNKLLGSFYILRHGEAMSNVENIFSSSLNDGYYLTNKGVRDIEKVAEELADKKIDLIISSDYDRTKQTAEIIAKKTGSKIIFDERLRETCFGDYVNKKFDNVPGVVEKWDDGADYAFPNGENRNDLGKRAESFFNDLFRNYLDKNVLVVAHGDILTSLQAVLAGKDYWVELKKRLGKNYIQKGKLIKTDFKVINLHKHIVDKITFPCEETCLLAGRCGGTMKRVPEVLDCWFESGSVPHAQYHYPFSSDKFNEKGETEEKNLRPDFPFPADFIIEYTGQLRGWFYYLHVISNALFDSKCFKNVITTGVLAGTDGRKMSKLYGNYPDPKAILEKYGADALRLYFMSSPLMLGEDMNMSERDLEYFFKNPLRMLWNSYSFFVLYANIDKYHETRNTKHVTKNENLLDRWIISELNILIKETRKNLDKYDIASATRLLAPFIDNLSNWYIRRSRKRFWKSENDEDKNEAYQTLHYVLITLAKLMAPFTPFISEEIYRNLSEAGNKNFCSVHLENFPQADEKLIDEKLNKDMSNLREIISIGLQERAKNGIKVRQPLGVASIKHKVSNAELENIMKEELNVKEINVDENQGEDIILDTNITKELKLEGQAREIIRYIQEMRKAAGFEIDNRIEIGYVGAGTVFEKFGDIIAKETLAEELKSGDLEDADLEKEFDLDGEKLKLGIKKFK